MKINYFCFTSFVLPIVMALSLGGCFLRRNEVVAIKLSEVRPLPPERKVLRLKVPRHELANRAEGSQIRLVEVFNPGQEDNPVKEWRMFDISPSSAAALVGLENNDVLLAANDYVVAAPYIFHQYLRYLPREKEGTIEVRRAGRPVLIQIELVE
jgi:hypothetical protein